MAKRPKSGGFNILSLGLAASPAPAGGPAAATAARVPRAPHALRVPRLDARAPAALARSSARCGPGPPLAPARSTTALRVPAPTRGAGPAALVAAGVARSARRPEAASRAGLTRLLAAAVLMVPVRMLVHDC
eukprot:CAMPEP_0115643968 /NCGR_PEP_ID=MMETSP0272-20121206/37643_1 /TAXON_ID=71861 /ORGANISM="Scrippsiella trochoidea, Strain CCMP3099" /LENGTH=131 /DNA_ID=CAMNT_0003081391 /DNA_START=159 /DNA_END=551 /DNA_ORIENTATION=+